MPLPPTWRDAEFYYVTTTGRRSGRPHTVEMWFAEYDGRLYALAGRGERGDWVRNLRASSDVTVRVGDEERHGHAYVVTDPLEEAAARQVVAAKYQRWRQGDELSAWAATALPVAIGGLP